MKSGFLQHINTIYTARAHSRRGFVLVLVLCLSVCASLSSCSFFEPRTPEEPSGGTTGFQQPISENIVLSNFQSAVQESNTENLIRCLADTTLGARQPYKFDASIDVLTTFAEQFRQWSTVNERQAFLSMTSKIPAPGKINLQLLRGRFDVRVPDSAVYAADYILRVPHVSPSVPTLVAGTIRLTMFRDDFNQWYIGRWSDAKGPENDTISNTWSALKAQFSN
ncbi:MAG: hypothetical protein RL156_1648 [Bacteroidota bacterium]|jgi:hypothetical protein